MSTVVRKSSYHSHQNNPLQSTDVQLAARGREGLCHLRLLVRGLRPAGALGSLAGEHPIKVHFEEIVNFTFSGGEGAEEATATSTESEREAGEEPHPDGEGRETPGEASWPQVKDIK